MAGIYIHIPFCKQKCSYCDFHFSTLLKFKPEVIRSIAQEITLRKNEISENINTIYFGGGTPSLLSEKELSLLIDTIFKHFDVAPTAEITLECNPDDINPAFLNIIKKTPINRLSMGVQSFFDEDLLLMNRSHNAQEADAAIKRAQDAGFTNITIDLIYGAPTTSHAMWQKNLETVITLDIPHVSAYALTVEPQTLLAHQIQKQILSPIEDHHQAQQFEQLVNYLEKHDFVAYEISNFGKEGFFSQHNSNYWKGIPYLGFGPSAHSFHSSCRRWNVANNHLYVKGIQQNGTYFESEILSEKDEINERIMTGLRTIWGVNLMELNEKFSEECMRILKQNLGQSHLKNKLIWKGETLHIHSNYRFFADGIASDLFIV